VLIELKYDLMTSIADRPVYKKPSGLSLPPSFGPNTTINPRIQFNQRMQFFKSVVVLALATYVTASALPSPQAVCGGPCGFALPPCATGCICTTPFIGTVSNPLSFMITYAHANHTQCLPSQ